MPGPLYRFGDFTLSTPARELRRDGVRVQLSPRAFDCLVYLIEQRERAVNKDELVEAIWGRPNVSDTQLGQTVLRARRAVGDDGQVQHVIRTVSRFGYHWIADVEVVDGGDANPAAEFTAAPPHNADRPGLDDDGRDWPRPSRRRLRFIIAAAGLVMLLGVLFALRGHFLRRETASGGGSANAVVLPLQVDAEPDQAWLRLGAMDLIADRLRDGGMTVLPSENVVALLHAARGADSALLRRDAPNAWLIDGSFRHRDNRWSLALHAIAADGTRLDVESSQPQALDAAREAADRLLGRLGRLQAPTPVGVAPAPVRERLQRAQAAMLANDLDEARAILISDPDLAHAEPQLGYRLAQVDFRAGEYRRAETSLSALLTEPAASEPLFHARLLNARAGVRLRMDDDTDAERDYDDAIALLRGGKHAPELGLALTGRGVARGIRHAFAAALADLGEARAQLQAAGDVLAIARVDSNLGGLEMNRDRPEQALGYLESAATRFEEYGAINELMETLESLVSDNLALLRPSAALAASDRSWALAARVTDPNQGLNLVLDRVDVLLAVGRLSEASRWLAGLPAVAVNANPFLARRLPALRARLAFAEGRYADAASAAQQALALPAPTDDSGEGIAEIELVEQRAQLAATSSRTRTLRDTDSTYPVQAVLAAERAVADGDAAVAERHYRTALDLAERRGVPYDVALVTQSYGPWLLKQGRTEQASEIIGRVSPWAERDYDCALLQVDLFHALGKVEAWTAALRQARTLAGEREIPAVALTPPLAPASAAAVGVNE